MRWEVATPISAYIVYRAYTHASLTPAGCVVAAVTAIIHALHPSPLPFTLLLVFFAVGTTATKVKKEVKATLTLSSTGSHTRSTNSNVVADVFSGGWNKTSEYHDKREAAKKVNASTAGGQEARSAVQVLANSGCVSVLCLLHIYLYGLDTGDKKSTLRGSSGCLGSNSARDVILAGIVGNYAAVMADTLSSELGILSPHKPRLIMNLLEVVPPGTNGGITGIGLGAGLAGALLIGAVSTLFLPTPCGGKLEDTFGLILAIGSWGGLGSVLDSILGAVFQASVIDVRSQKVVEAPNGGRVLVVAKKEKDDGDKGKPSRIIGTGSDILDNNQVNFVMAATMTVGAMVLTGQAWHVPISAFWANL